MDVQTIIMAAAMGVLYWIANGYLGYTLWISIGTPFTMGLVAGLIYGDVATGIILAGSIKLIYLGVFAPGGQLPADEGIAAACVIPIALKTGMAPEVAISLAVPVGLLGAFLYNFKKIANCMFVVKADQYAEEGNMKGVWRCASIWPFLLSSLLFFLPVFLVNIFGADVVKPILNAIPEWLMHGLEVAGGVLPAVGFAMIIYMIGKAKYIPLFLIGFYLVKIANINTLVAGVFAVCIAITAIVLKREVKEELADE